MADNDNDLPVTLPEELRRQFAQVERRLWRVETSVAACAIAAGLIVSLLALFVSDRVWDTPVWLRLFFLLSGIAAAGLAAMLWAQRWVWQRRDLKALAKIVQKKHRRLGDRLLGIVELANEKRHSGNFSPALYQAAIRQVADDASGCDFRQSVSAGRAKKTSLLAGALAAGLGLIFALFPQPATNSFHRWAAPMAGVPRYTLVALDGLPTELVVPHGEPFDIAATVHYRSFWQPRHGSALWPRQAEIEGDVTDGKIRLQIPGEIEDGRLQVRVGDARAEVYVRPTFRPALQDLSATIHLPAYLRYPEQTQALQTGSLLAVEGSTVAFQGKVSRPLSAALMQNGGDAPAALKIDGNNFATALLQPEGAAELTFNWRDHLGLSNAVPLRLSVQMEPDAPPTPEIVGLPREIALLVSDVLRVPVRAKDDFGVRDLGLTWDLTEDSPHGADASTEIKIQTSAPNVTSAEKTFLWSPTLFGIPADSTVELEGYARDYFPERERARTATYVIHVLSPEEHAEAVRQQLEAVLAQIEEVTRLQEKVVAGVAEVKDAEKMPEAQKSARLGQSKDDQSENAAHLNDLSKQGEAAVREAMKNPLFKEETIREWSHTMQQWRQLAQDKMPGAADQMQAAQEHPQSPSPETGEALKKAQDILEALEKMESQANQHMDDLQALTLSQRLRKVGGQEKQIGGQLLESAPSTIGLLPKGLPEKIKIFESGLTHDQSGAQSETVTLEGEVSRFFERTQKPTYGEVSQEMKSTHVADELDRVGGLIENNIGIEASDDLSQWSDRFQKWSEKLEPKPSSQSPSSPGSSGQKQKEDLTKELIALLRLRENEMNLRDQTTVLDQSKSEADYKDRAVALAGTQDSLAGDLEAIHKDTALPQLDPAFDDSSRALGKARDLLRQPQTGKPADDAEVTSIESLSDLINLINEQAQRPPPQQSQSQSPGEQTSAEEMQFLLQMMRNSADAKAMSTQPATGLNRAGGTTDRAGGIPHGNASGKAPGTRDIEKASGIIQNSPAEFREALENYFHGIEQSR
jgi:hypothetical protein